VFGLTLASIHNERFVVGLVDSIRESVEKNNFFEYKKQFLTRYYGEGVSTVFFVGDPKIE
jgi:tRNA-guanine family transglycosylase